MIEPHFAPRPLYGSEHEELRRSITRFCVEEVAPNHDAWEHAGMVDRSLWHKLGQAGYLASLTPERFGGLEADIRTTAVIHEELTASGFSSLLGAGVHDIVVGYLIACGTETQKQHYLPKMISGECVGAIAMTEPAAGSDLQGVQTRAVREGDMFRINGSKTFITNGQSADVVIVVAKTNPKEGSRGTSLILVERDTPGFERGRNLEKMGQKSQDTSELFFHDVRVPVSNLLGGENQGFYQLMQELPFERLLIGLHALGGARAAYRETVAYVRERRAFGKAIVEFQNTRYVLADLKTQIEVGAAFVDKCVALYQAGQLSTDTASMCKLWLTEMQGRVVDACVQLHGGYGYMWESPIARLYADARVQRIYGGTSEIMKELISRNL